MNAAVTVSLVGTKPGRPPLERLLVDVQLRNDDADPRWVVIPRTVPLEKQGGVDKLEQLTVPAGNATIAVGRFLGSMGVYALKLAPGARVNLRKLELNWWRPESGANDIAFDIVLAQNVELGDTQMVNWFDKDPVISGSVDVDMETAKHTRSQKSPHDGDELPVGVAGATVAPIKLVAH